MEVKEYFINNSNCSKDKCTCGKCMVTIKQNGLNRTVLLNDLKAFIESNNILYQPKI